VIDIRNFGLAGALQIEAIPGEPAVRRPFAIALKCWEKGLYVRWTGDTIQLGPPLVSEQRELEDAIGILRDVISTVD
jgi:beta-alanine--pyruvate transaminase